MAQSLTNFKALSFDCYGTLINWESGIFKALELLLNRLSKDHQFQDQDTVIKHFNQYQSKLIRAPEEQQTLYRDLMANCYTGVARDAGLAVSQTEALAFGRSVGQLEAFPDTVDGLLKLKKYYKLIIVSNVDNDNITNTITGPLGGVEFDAVLTAEDIGSYKPSHINFNFLLNTLDRQFGLSKKDLLHVAKSLPVDHVPAKQLDLTSAWIARGKDGVSAMGGDPKDFGGQVAFTWRFASIGEMAEEVEKAFAAEV